MSRRYRALTPTGKTKPGILAYNSRPHEPFAQLLIINGDPRRGGARAPFSLLVKLALRAAGGISVVLLSTARYLNSCFTASSNHSSEKHLALTSKIMKWGGRACWQT